MLQLQQRTELWKDTGWHVVVIAFEQRELLSRLAEDYPAEWTFISDPERKLYEIYGVESAAWTRIYAPRTLVYYLRTHLRRIFRRPAQRPAFDAERDTDRSQLGGDFLIGADGRILYVHPSAEPADRPSAETLLGIVRANL